MTDNDDDKGNIRPAYYNRGGIEAVDVIRAWGLGFDLGSALKYIARAGHKPKDGDLRAGHIEDLRKARTYLDIELACLISEDDDDEDTNPGYAPRLGLQRQSVTQQQAPSSPKTIEWSCARCEQVKTQTERYDVGKPFEGSVCALCAAQVRAIAESPPVEPKADEPAQEGS